MTEFEKMGCTYRQEGDYFLPNLKIGEQDEVLIGVWGQRHRQYLKKHHHVRYYNLLTAGALNSYLNIPQMHHVGKVPFGYGDGRFFNLAGPYRTDTAPGSSQREHANPVEKASQLNVRHGPGCRVPSRQAPLPVWSPQCPAARQPQYRFLHPRP